jgi:hypothetical protein
MAPSVRHLVSHALAGALVLPSLLLLAITAGPAAADPPWVIDMPVSVVNETRILNASIIIEQGGTLTVENASILFDLATEGSLNITVKPGGSLVVHNGTLRASDTARGQQRHWNFLVSGHLELSGADISDLRGDVGEGGVEIDGSDALIEDSFVHNNRYYGLFLKSGAPLVRRTIFDFNVVAVFVLPGASPVLEDLTIRNSTSFGLKVNDGSPVVRNITVTGSSNFAIGAIGSILDIVGCHISGGFVGIDAARGTTGRISACEILTVGTGLRAQDSPVAITNSTFFTAGVGVNATHSAVQVTSNQFLNVDVGVVAREAPDGVEGGSATFNNFSGLGVGLEIHNPNFFASDNTYSPSITSARVFHEVTLFVVNRAGDPVLRALVNITDAQGVRVFTGLTNDTGAVAATLEEYRLLGNGTRLNLTPHAVSIDRAGALTLTTVNATSDHTERIALVDSPQQASLAVTREALLLIAAVFGAAAAISALGMRARRRAKTRGDKEERTGGGRHRRGPRGGR